MIKFSTLLSLIIILNSANIRAFQSDAGTVSDPPEDEEISSPGIIPVLMVDYGSPQKYGGSISLAFGLSTLTRQYFDEEVYRDNYGFRGLDLEAGIHRGGYRFAAYYAKLGSSMFGMAGTRFGISYLNNNSYSTVMKRDHLIGIEAEFRVLYFLRMGIFKEMDGNRVIPQISFGLALSPYSPWSL